eukprot:1615847-Pleurochrysis_carterae.AAC.1
MSACEEKTHVENSSHKLSSEQSKAKLPAPAKIDDALGWVKRAASNAAAGTHAMLNSNATAGTPRC